MSKKVVLAMSGGVDSSVSVHLLTKAGYEVIGLTFIMSEDESVPGFLNFVNEAKIVASKFGIKHYVVDLKEEFENTIIKYFVESYINGKTPNPCVLCNPTVKWKNLVEFAQNIGIDKVATGHYAVIKKYNNRYYISQPADVWKNQTYFLWNLPQDYLSKTLFPIGDYLKSDVKKIAMELGVTEQAEKTESYDVCFIKDKDYREYLNKKLEEYNISTKAGDFVTEDGKIVGKHNGISNYTIGQRKGTGIAMGEPFFVKRIDKEKNQIVIAPRINMLQKNFRIENVNLMKYEKFEEDKIYHTKIRYRDKGNPAKIKISENKYYVEFENEVFGITPGQSAVFYEDNDLVGGGEIVLNEV